MSSWIDKYRSSTLLSDSEKKYLSYFSEDEFISVFLNVMGENYVYSPRMLLLTQGFKDFIKKQNIGKIKFS